MGKCSIGKSRKTQPPCDGRQAIQPRSKKKGAEYYAKNVYAPFYRDPPVFEPAPIRPETVDQCSQQRPYGPGNEYKIIYVFLGGGNTV